MVKKTRSSRSKTKRESAQQMNLKYKLMELDGVFRSTRKGDFISIKNKKIVFNKIEHKVKSIKEIYEKENSDSKVLKFLQVVFMYDEEKSEEFFIRTTDYWNGYNKKWLENYENMNYIVDELNGLFTTKENNCISNMMTFLNDEIETHSEEKKGGLKDYSESCKLLFNLLRPVCSRDPSEHMAKGRIYECIDFCKKEIEEIEKGMNK